MWIAIIFFFGTTFQSKTNGKSVTTQEFTSREACLDAKHILESAQYMDQYDRVIVHCVQK